MHYHDNEKHIYLWSVQAQQSPLGKRNIITGIGNIFQTTVTNVVLPKVLRAADRGDIMLINVTQEPTCMCYSLMGKLLYVLYPVNRIIYFKSSTWLRQERLGLVVPQLFMFYNLYREKNFCPKQEKAGQHTHRCRSKCFLNEQSCFGGFYRHWAKPAATLGKTL